MLLAAAVDGIADSSPFVQYLNLGVITILLGLMYARKIRFEPEVTERDIRIAKLEEAIEKYTEHYQKEVLPALIDVTRISGEILEFLHKQAK